MIISDGCDLQFVKLLWYMCIYNICIICCILYVYIYDICIIYDNTMQKYICLTLFKVEFSPQSLPPSSLLSSPTSELHHLHQQMDQSRLELISNTDHDAYFRRHCSLMSFDSIVLIINPRVEKIHLTKLINHWPDKIDKSLTRQNW